MNDWNTAALHDHMARQDRADEQRKWLEREAEEMEFDTTAGEHRFKDYGLWDELLTHHEAAMKRLLLKRDDTHPYNGPGGEQMELDDRAAIEQHETVWAEVEAQRLADKWIEDQI